MQWARTTRSNTPQTADSTTAWMAVAVASVVLLVFANFMGHIGMDVVFGILTVGVLVLLTVPMLTWIGRKEGDRSWTRLLLWGLVAKFVGTLVRYYVITVIYGDTADAGNYSHAGIELAKMYLNGQFTLHPPSLVGRGVETERIGVVVGVIFVFTGSSRYAASFIFSWFCYLGQVLMWRAMRRAVPEADARRYAILILFLPSMLFWPSSIGKEALMVASIGVASYGAAQILGSKVSVLGIGTFLAGAAGLFFIRPHMALISIVALAFANLVSSLAGFKREDATKAFFVRIVAIGMLIAGGSFAMTQLSKVLAGNEADGGGVESVLARTQKQTSTGGSEFVPPAVRTPVQIPAAIVTVLYRPFPWEARNANGLIAAGEGMLLGTLTIAGRRRIVNWGRYALRRPYLIYTMTFAVVFIVAFSYIGNFGILARQRTQMLPLGLTLLAMPVATYRRAPLFGLTSRTRRTAGVDPAVDPATEGGDALTGSDGPAVGAGATSRRAVVQVPGAAEVAPVHSRPFEIPFDRAPERRRRPGGPYRDPRSSGPFEVGALT